MVASALTISPDEILEQLVAYAHASAERNGVGCSDLVAGAMMLAIGLLTNCCGWSNETALRVCQDKIARVAATIRKGGA